MLKVIFNLLLGGSALVSSFIISDPTLAGDITIFQITQKSTSPSLNVDNISDSLLTSLDEEMREASQINEMEQVTSVSQLSDVRPTDWAFQALQSLVERYGCIAGYPDKTYRGNRVLTRYEFAAGLNACLDRVNELIEAATADLIKKEDLAILQKLQEEFAAELATLRGRVDALESRTATFEKQQFSTTTKLVAEVVVGLTSILAGENTPGNKIDRVPILGHRTRLNFEASFTGSDLLRVRPQASNLTSFSNVTGTSEGYLRFDTGLFNGGNSEVGLDQVLYDFPLGGKTRVALQINSGASDDFTSTLNSYIDGDGATGALSNFATRNSITYYYGSTGAGIKHEFNNWLELGVGYAAGNASDPTAGNGAFNGAYGALAQLIVKPSEKFNIGLIYVNAYNTNTGTGSNNSNLQAAIGSPVSINSYSIAATFQASPKFVVNGWVGYTAARAIRLGDAEIWNWNVSLAFPDLGKKGNLGGISVGMEPRLTRVGNGITAATGITKDPDTSLHLEAFYQYRVNDNISVTPGVIWLTAPDHNNNNDDVVIGVLRTTFNF